VGMIRGKISFLAFRNILEKEARKQGDASEASRSLANILRLALQRNSSRKIQHRHRGPAAAANTTLDGDDHQVSGVAGGQPRERHAYLAEGIRKGWKATTAEGYWGAVLASMRDLNIPPTPVDRETTKWLHRLAGECIVDYPSPMLIEQHEEVLAALRSQARPDDHLVAMGVAFAFGQRISDILLLQGNDLRATASLTGSKTPRPRALGARPWRPWLPRSVGEAVGAHLDARAAAVGLTQLEERSTAVERQLRPHI
jgi:hypothetical protein